MVAGEEWSELEIETDYRWQQFTEYYCSWQTEENKTFANTKDSFVA